LGRRNVAGVTKGEAGDLLDAQIVRRGVRDALRADAPAGDDGK
jgi:hypothetical protein